jgi:hypothetical protein
MHRTLTAFLGSHYDAGLGRLARSRLNLESDW